MRRTYIVRYLCMLQSRNPLPLRGLHHLNSFLDLASVLSFSAGAGDRLKVDRYLLELMVYYSMLGLETL
jgi:hypothetical protein